MAWARHLSRRQQQALLDGPAMEPPPGIIPNFTNPPNHVALGLGILFAVSTVAGFLIFCQLYSRIVLIHKVGVADCKCNQASMKSRELMVERYRSCGFGKASTI